MMMMDKHLDSMNQVVEEITRLHRSLPPRPDPDDVEAAASLIENDDQNRSNFIDRQLDVVPRELLDVLREMRRGLVRLQSKEQKREAAKVLDLESAHVLFDELIQRASNCVVAASSNANQTPVKSKEVMMFTRDDTFVTKVKSTLYSDGFLAPRKPQVVDSTLTGNEEEKLSLIKLATLIEVSSKKATQELNLQHKLMDNLEWLPDSLGKLSSLVRLDLSENCIMVLPATIGGLLSLTRLDLHSNRIGQVPESIGDLMSLVNCWA
ncbi:Leucine-rich repeat-containing protein [Hirschfeldia incana]|nr:Leucine-rich repeat-containing protein [Hirschfeldia incana]